MASCVNLFGLFGQANHNKCEAAQAIIGAANQFALACSIMLQRAADTLTNYTQDGFDARDEKGGISEEGLAARGETRAGAACVFRTGSSLSKLRVFH
jgi:hypothetical protein